MSGHIRKLAALGEVRGAVERLLDGLRATADAVALVGDLGVPWSKPDTYRSIFRALGEARLPAFWVPGPTDAPLGDYLRESYNMEIAYPLLRSVHGTVAVGPGEVVFFGLGGEIVDDPHALRDEEALLRYPGWEVEYRLKVIGEFKEHQKVFLFTTPPAHKGLDLKGSEVLAELIKTYRPRVVIASGDLPLQERLGSTLVVYPGRADRGECAMVDLRTRSASVAALAEAASIGGS